MATVMKRLAAQLPVMRKRPAGVELAMVLYSHSRQLWMPYKTSLCFMRVPAAVVSHDKVTAHWTARSDFALHSCKSQLKIAWLDWVLEGSLSCIHLSPIIWPPRQLQSWINSWAITSLATADQRFVWYQSEKCSQAAWEVSLHNSDRVFHLEHELHSQEIISWAKGKTNTV